MSNIDSNSGSSNEQPSTAEKAATTIIENLEKCGFDSEFQGAEAKKRKQQLIEIAQNLPTIALRILHKFRQLTTNESLDAGKISFFVVGGRVAATPIKDNSDFDVVITAEKRLHPSYDKHISWAQRHSIAKALYQEVESLFKELGIGHLYEKGIFEFKGFGERTSETLEKEQDTLKIAGLSATQSAKL